MPKQFVCAVAVFLLPCLLTGQLFAAPRVLAESSSLYMSPCGGGMFERQALSPSGDVFFRPRSFASQAAVAVVTLAVGSLGAYAAAHHPMSAVLLAHTLVVIIGAALGRHTPNENNNAMSNASQFRANAFESLLDNLSYADLRIILVAYEAFDRNRKVPKKDIPLPSRYFELERAYPTVLGSRGIDFPPLLTLVDQQGGIRFLENKVAEKGGALINSALQNLSARELRVVAHASENKKHGSANYQFAESDMSYLRVVAAFRHLQLPTDRLELKELIRVTGGASRLLDAAMDKELEEFSVSRRRAQRFEADGLRETARASVGSLLSHVRRIRESLAGEKAGSEMHMRAASNYRFSTIRELFEAFPEDLANARFHYLEDGTMSARLKIDVMPREPLLRRPALQENSTDDADVIRKPTIYYRTVEDLVAVIERPELVLALMAEIYFTELRSYKFLDTELTSISETVRLFLRYINSNIIASVGNNAPQADPYKVLGIDDYHATPGQIREAFIIKNLALKKSAPDFAAREKALETAYTTLSSPIERAAYDAREVGLGSAQFRAAPLVRAAA